MTEGKPHLDHPTVAAKARHKEGEAGHRHGGIFGERTELIFAGLAGGARLAGWVLSSRATVGLRRPSMSGRATAALTGVTRWSHQDERRGVSTGTSMIRHRFPLIRAIRSIISR